MHCVSLLFMNHHILICGLLNQHAAETNVACSVEHIEPKQTNKCARDHFLGLG